MKAQREKFEDWVKQRWHKPNLETFRNAYVNTTIQEQWQAWQAAIESVVVELPEPHQDEWKELNLSVDEVKKALDDAGVKYVLPETFVRY